MQSDPRNARIAVLVEFSANLNKSFPSMTCIQRVLLTEVESARTAIGRVSPLSRTSPTGSGSGSDRLCGRNLQLIVNV